MTGIVGRVEQDLQERLGGSRLGDPQNGAA
jgi:hypothetical protein